MKENKRVLVVFGEKMPKVSGKYDTVLFGKDLENLIDPGSVEEAGEIMKEFPNIALPSGELVSKSFMYEGYELWWMNYNTIFYYFSLPYTQYRKMLEYLRDFNEVNFYNAPYKTLFFYYLEAHGTKVKIISSFASRLRSLISPGIFFQIILTLISLPILIIKRNPYLIFIGDKLDKNKDHDFRMGFLYQELRNRDLKFVEFIRSIEPWKVILKNFFIRRRPVVYYNAVAFISKYLSILSGNFYLKEFEYIKERKDLPSMHKFKLLAATHYLQYRGEDIIGIRLMKIILKLLGVKASYITAANERNFYVVLGSKLNLIPTVGILHGVASPYGTPYDYMTGFNGEKILSVDRYGLWSEWWKEQYKRYSDAYKEDQLYVSGPMRPLVLREEESDVPSSHSKAVRVLLIAEQTASPMEVMPYIDELLKHKDLKLTIKFRPFKDGFENWLLENKLELLKRDDIEITKGDMESTIRKADVVLGCHSTAALEALLQLKPPVFMHTRKWGDYYKMSDSEDKKPFIAYNPEELIEKIHGVKSASRDLLKEMREQYFGDPHKNGSAWVVRQLEDFYKM